VLFNSFSFFIFFPLVTVLYFLFPHRYRWAMLLVSSCIFYMWFIPKYILILGITIVIDYLAGIFIQRSVGSIKKVWLVISIISTCLVLFVFKYFNFFSHSFVKIASVFGLNYPINVLNVILPIGLSFHTFQSLSYVIEVYRGNQKAEKHFGIYALYVMFYPQLVAGPIERPQNLIHQFYEKHSFDYKRVTDGLKLMAWGLFKKVVIADRLSILVNQVYDHPSSYDGSALIIATIFFAFQIYCDFSGYSDIAIGAAEVMGFKLMTNFNRPYFSKSISEFWKRWHISLSTWFKDYLYISLGGNRCSKFRWQLNLFFTFLISGLWHGANWTYVVWGGLNGVYLIFGLWIKRINNRVKNFAETKNIERFFAFFQVITTFSLICFSWIFFRAKNISDALYVITNLFTGWRIKDLFEGTVFGIKNGEISIEYFFTSVGFVFFLIIIEKIQGQHRSVLHMLRSETPAYIRWAVYYTMLVLLLFFGVYGEKQFIYFQF
jgi:alginate O-acetyltransferase complex protein AlgI